MFNKTITYSFFDFLRCKSIKQMLGKKNYRSLQKKLDIKTYVKLQKKMHLLTKVLFNKKSYFIYKILTKSYQNKEHFKSYFLKKGL